MDEGRWTKDYALYGLEVRAKAVSMKVRFREEGQSLYEFADLFLVRCPRCEKCAQVIFKEPVGDVPAASSKPSVQVARLFRAPRRLICEHCGYTKDWQKGTMHLGGPNDWFFGAALWLQAPCCGEVLWALNSRHLDLIEDYVKAELREGFSPLTSKMPTWLKTAKNRDEVLHCIGRLREKL